MAKNKLKKYIKKNLLKSQKNKKFYESIDRTMFLNFVINTVTRHISKTVRPN